MTNPTNIKPGTILPVPVPVQYKNGRSETVFVEQLSLLNRYKFLHLLADMKTPELVVLCVGKPLSWLEELDDGCDCYDQLVETCYRLNFHSALKLAKKDPALGAKVVPLLAAMQKTLELASESLSSTPNGSSGGLFAPLPPESAAATRTPSAA